jgi:diacylglycerol kinase family enzyme
LGRPRPWISVAAADGAAVTARFPFLSGPPTIALIANPGSGSGEAHEVAGRLRDAGAEVREFGLGEADEAVRSGAGRLVVAGGDGSIAPAAATAGAAEMPLAVVPIGTANDFARATGLPTDVEEACRLAVEGGNTRPLDLGRMSRRPFVNVASLGLAPAAARRAKGLKRALGPFSYAVGAVRAGVAAEPVECSVRCADEEVFAGAAWQVTVACSGAFGGGSSVPARPGALDLVAIESGSRAKLAWRAFGLRSGRIGQQDGVRTHRCRQAEVLVAKGTQWNVDGEVVRTGPVSFEVEPSAFELVVP